MGYAALEEMRKTNLERFGRDVGPFPPVPIGNEAEGFDLKSAALRFLEKRCEGLRYSARKEAAEQKTGKYLGTSLKPGQIPYNMQMDIDRICLKNELARFIDSGVAEDAYTVYYAFLEMFLGQDGQSHSMVELLSEFESNASSLLMSHRDHYSHSVYVFALGLAIYETNPAFRGTFAGFYGLKDGGEGTKSACFFLEFWGLTALFHDIGYPFEIPFEQVLAYFEVDRKKRGADSVFLAYQNVKPLVKMEKEERARMKKFFGRDFADLVELMAFGITEKLGSRYGFTEDKMLQRLNSKPIHPEQNGYYMDHAFFSAGRLWQELVRILGPEKLTKTHVDVLTAIMLHNSLFKFAILNYKTPELRAPLKAEWHPLAWLLMLCDELQCWDRTAYGRNSRTELQPMGVEFDFSFEAIRARYIYDREEEAKIAAFTEALEKWKNSKSRKKGECPRLKAYSDMEGRDGGRFRADLGQIVDLGICPVTVRTTLRKANRRLKHTYLSSSSFLHIHHFAVALHARYIFGELGSAASDGKKIRKMENEFNSLSLEYKISNINQVRSFAGYLHHVRCFYTDRPVDFDMLPAFTPKMVAVFAPMEHVRWVRDHQAMGWTAGDDYETLRLKTAKKSEAAERKNLREQLRMHKLSLPAGVTEKAIREHYDTLSREEQEKDALPFNCMLELLKLYDGIRIYRLK